MTNLYDSRGQQPPRSGLILLQAIILALFCAFALRLWYLQVHKGEEYAEKAKENQLRMEPVFAPRGLILDRGGTMVAVNEPAGWTFGRGGEVLCTTCHKPHSALKNSPMLRPPASKPTFCEECHSTPIAHHPTGGMSGGGSVNSGKPHASTREPVIPSTFPSGITYGNASNNALYC
jgi:predicted CXXCH cytochrome family protein